MMSPLDNGDLSATLEELRVDLAAALRLAARFDLHEGIDNHFSVAVPEHPAGAPGEVFLVNPYGTHWSRLKASDIMLCHADGTVIEGDSDPDPTAFFIHSRIHVNVPHARAILHTHQPYATALTMIEDGELAMAEQNALRFYSRIAYDREYAGLAFDGAEGDRMAAKLGNRSIMFLANHGVITTGNTIAEAFDDLYFLERAAKFQVLARSTGQPLKLVPEPVVKKTFDQMRTVFAPMAKAHFDALKQILDAEEPDYRH